MNQTDVMVRIVELAKVGGAMPLQEAVAALAAVIDHLDMYSDTYEADVAALMGVGAAICVLNGPGAGHDPEWVPPVLRP
ncbi:hypothetical protein [Variovorax sp. LT1R16]|uniref:hypothetical protein n=1 Tax=Variovorax sp. LT1R16 TaxID=3443728 RepID=UPI003F4570A2